MHRSKCVPLVLLTAITACDASPATDPVSGDAAASAVTLLECPAAPAQQFTASAGLLGGVLSGAGVTVVIPAGALLGQTDFVVTVPTSGFAEIDVTANGAEHFRFLQPVILTIDYGRCGADPSASRSVWHIDSENKTPLENMGGIDDVLGKRMIFSTVHLSGYAIAN